MLLEQLKELSKTMEKSTKSTLEMHDWVYELVDKEGNFCGFAACVCGEQALIGDLSVFDVERPKNDNLLKFRELAKNIALTLDDSCEELFGNTHLSESIYDNHYGLNIRIRLGHTKSSGLFTDEELRNSRHLNKEYPTPADAKEYIDLCIEKVNEAMREM